MVNKKEKVVIVGSGMAGLTAAAYLSREYFDVLLLEKNTRTGGLVYTFENKGFSFDAGPRAFVNSGMVRPILKDLDIEWEVLPNTITIGVEDQSFRVEKLDSIKEYEKMLINLYPENEDEIKEIISIIRKLSKHTAVLYEFDNPYFVDYVSDKKVLFGKLLPWSFRLLFSLRQFNKYNMPMEEFLRSKTGNQSLINILTQYFFRETPTYFALGYFHVYMDYFYPKKGTMTLPSLLQEKILAEGGKIQYKTSVEEVIPAEKRVVDSHGNSYEYDHLIWAADLKTMYRQINSNGLQKKVEGKLKLQNDKIQSAKAAESVYILFLGVNRPTSYFKEISGEHMFYTPSKVGLGEISTTVKQTLLDNFDTLSKKELMQWAKTFCNLNTYEVSIPALRDSALAPDNQTGIMISCLFDYEVAKKVEEKGWLPEFKETMEEQIIKLFSDSIFQGVKEDIIFKQSSTPLTLSKITGNSQGAIVGWSFETKAPVFNKLKDLSKTVLTPFSDIYQASQWAYAPAGVPIAMLTGWHATQKIINKSKKKK